MALETAERNKQTSTPSKSEEDQTRQAQKKDEFRAFDSRSSIHSVHRCQDCRTVMHGWQLDMVFTRVFGRGLPAISQDGWVGKSVVNS